MEKKHVWFASAGSASRATNPIAPVGQHAEDDKQFELEERKARRAAREQRFTDLNGGKLFDPEEWGTVWAQKAETRAKKLQCFNSFGGAGVYVVAGPVKALLEQNDIGPVRFHPIEVLNIKRTAPLWPGAELFHMNVGTTKRALDRDATPRAALFKIGDLPDGAPLCKPIASDEHDVYVFDPSVLSGPELWQDDTLQGALFLSDALAKALTAAKLDNGWQLKRCAVGLLH